MARTSAHAGLPLVGAARTALVILALGLALAACGRRGALQPPPAPEGQQQTQAGEGQRTGVVVANGDDEDDDDSASVVSSPVPGGAKKRAKGITIPKKPFILDPLL